MPKEKKLSPETKVKLILQGEYLIIGLLFLVLGILKLTDVLRATSEIRFKVFNFITLVGSLWIITDLIWFLASKKRQEKADLLDKVLILPAGLFLLVFDIISLINWNKGIGNIFLTPEWPRFGVGGVFVYIGAIYVFEAIYHWFRPSKTLLNAIKEDEEEKQKQLETKEDGK